MLYVVATPIGNLKDISQRAIETLLACEIIVGEEQREASTLLKRLNIKDKEIRLLNEHSDRADLYEIVDFCKIKTVALITDCGTPVFSDPGAELISACRKKNIPVTTIPGASSLMALLSLSSKNLDQFIFQGFLPANKDERLNAIRKLKSETRHQIVMDTPYRLKSLLESLAGEMPNRNALLAINLTMTDETILEGSLKELSTNCHFDQAEFMILIYSNQP